MRILILICLMLWVSVSEAAIVRLASPKNLKGWETGSVLAVYPDDMELNWGEEAHFILLKIPDKQAKDLKRLEDKIDVSSLNLQEREANFSIKTKEEWNTTGHGLTNTYIIEINQPVITKTDKRQWPKEFFLPL